jgi:hypothetical protein
MGAAPPGDLLGRIMTEILGHMIHSRPPEVLFFLGLGFLFAVVGVGAGAYRVYQDPADLFRYLD